jgi:transposase
MTIMETVAKKRKSKPYPPRRTFSKEFRDGVVETYRQSNLSAKQVAAQFDISDGTLHNWVRQAEVDEGTRSGVQSAERQELAALRKENRQLLQDLEILKRAMAFFAKETR